MEYLHIVDLFRPNCPFSSLRFKKKKKKKNYEEMFLFNDIFNGGDGGGGGLSLLSWMCSESARADPLFPVDSTWFLPLSQCYKQLGRCFWGIDAHISVSWFSWHNTNSFHYLIDFFKLRSKTNKKQKIYLFLLPFMRCITLNIEIFEWWWKWQIW